MATIFFGRADDWAPTTFAPLYDHHKLPFPAFRPLYLKDVYSKEQNATANVWNTSLCPLSGLTTASELELALCCLYSPASRSFTPSTTVALSTELNYFTPPLLPLSSEASVNLDVEEVFHRLVVAANPVHVEFDLPASTERRFLPPGLLDSSSDIQVDVVARYLLGPAVPVPSIPKIERKESIYPLTPPGLTRLPPGLPIKAQPHLHRLTPPSSPFEGAVPYPLTARDWIVRMVRLGIKEIGGGASGQVYAAQDVDGRRWALKKVPSQIWKKWPSGGTSESRMWEIDVLEYLNGLGIEGIIKIHAWFKDDFDDICIATPLYSHTLYHAVNDRRLPANPQQLKQQVIRPLVAALAAMHEAGVSHGDTKPQNIVFDEDLGVAYIDFDLATSLGDPIPVLGTQGWGPEDYDVNPTFKVQHDLWRLGKTLLFVFTGIFWDHMSIDLVSFLDYYQSAGILTANQSDLIERMCQYDAHHRPDSAADVLDLPYFTSLSE